VFLDEFAGCAVTRSTLFGGLSHLPCVLLAQASVSQFLLNLLLAHQSSVSSVAATTSCESRLARHTSALPSGGVVVPIPLGRSAETRTQRRRRRADLMSSRDRTVRWFDDRGIHTLRGVPDQWQLFAAGA
jgi:hypothetical protein